MSPTINLSEDQYHELGRYGNRDESWDNVVARVLEHVDDEAALNDKRKRVTTYSNEDSADTPGKGSANNSVLQKLENGTTIRHQYQRGNYSGTEAKARVVDGYVVYEDEKFTSPSPAAVKADRAVRGEDAASSLNGWTWWEYQDQDGTWLVIDVLRD